MEPILNLDEVEFDDVEENGLYTSSRGQIGDHIGAKKLGYNLTVLPPGKAQCPFHCHHGEEEMFLILEGEGELRFGNKRYPIREHDVIACPPGGPEVARQPSILGRQQCATWRSQHLSMSRRASTQILRRYSLSLDSGASEASEKYSVPRTLSTTTTARRPEDCGDSCVVGHGGRCFAGP